MPALLGFIFGTFIGSFLNVCIHRLPRNESVIAPRSRCYSCGTAIRWYDNLPVVGYLWLAGKCRWCGSAFSPRYLLMELAVGALTAVVMWWAFAGALGEVAAPWVLAAGGGELLARALAATVVLALVYYLLVAAMIDLDHLIIPDELTKSFQLAAPFLAVLAGANLAYLDLIDPRPWLWHVSIYGDERHLTMGHFLWVVLGIGVGAIVFLLLSLPLARFIYSRYCPAQQRWTDDDHRGFRLGVLWFVASSTLALVALVLLVVGCPEGANWWPDLAVHAAMAVLGSVVGWLALYLVGLIGTIAFRRNAMGFGDVKFLAPIGAFLGPVGVIYAFLAAAVVGAMIGIPMRLMRERREIPFGPYLALGALAVLLLGPHLHHRLFWALFH